MVVQFKTVRSVAMAYFVAVSTIGVLSTVAQAQNNMTLGRGQVLTVTPSGQVTISGMPNTAKAHQMMARHGRNMAKGLIIWMDQNGRMGYSEPSYFRDVVGGHGGYN